MSIKNVGELREGQVGDVKEGMVRLYTVNQYPIVEVYGIRDEFGNLLDSDDEIYNVAVELRDLWNQRVRGEK